MKQYLVALVVLAVASCGGNEEKKSTIDIPLPVAEEIKPSKHSANFNKNLDALLESYFSMKDALVSADMATTKSNAVAFAQKLDSLSLQELKQDSSVIVDIVSANISDLKGFANNIASETDVTKVREHFKSISETLYPSFLMALKYDGKKLFWQTCPMAFNDKVEASWISKTMEVVNPYLGNNHPKYKDKMLNCGEVKDSIYAK